MTKAGVYRHYKGNEYRLLYIATHSETLEKLVIYQALYGEGAIWARPLSMWEEKVETPDGVKERFEFVRD